MRILIIEDEELAAKRLSQMIRAIVPEAEIVGPLDTIRASVDHLNSAAEYDLIFMDIQLADGKSFSIFEECRILTPVIFTTAYDEYALRAFEHNSIDYLLKPVKKEKLKSSIDKFRQLKDYFGSDDANSKLYEIVKNLRLNNPVPYKDRFLVSKGDAMVLSEKLDPKLFFRVNRQYILSAEAIRKVYNHFNFKLKVELKVDPKAEIFVSRSKSAQFKAWMNGEN